MTSPSRKKLHSIPGPQDIHRVVLENGIILLVRENPESPSVVMNGYINSGSIQDPPEKLGLAFFTAAGLMRGTKSLTMQRLYDRIEGSAAAFGFNASVHTTGFGGRALSEDLPLLFDTLSDCLRNPLFPVLQMEKLRAQILTSLMIRAQDTAEMASIEFDKMLFKGHPYANPEDGYPETIKAITIPNVRKFRKENYDPRDMVITVVGGVETDAVIDLANKRLGDWKPQVNPARSDMPAPVPLTATERKHVELPEKHQTDLIMGTLGPSRKSADYFSASLGNNILGQFGMMGRIGGAVREQAGLAYTASTSLNAFMTTGTWEVSAGVNPANLEKAIDLIILELKKFVSEKVSQQELEDSKANYIGRMPIALESNSGVAGALLNIERFQLGLDYLQRYADMVKAVTAEQVLETARKYLHIDRLAIVSAGTTGKKT